MVKRSVRNKVADNTDIGVVVMPKVSIIVPVYNLEQFVKQCIESLMNQSFKDIEILLIDDGSTDSSPQICDSYAVRDSRVKVIHQKNMGLSGARNSGIRESCGRWFMIVDGDDWLEPNAVEILYAYAEKYQSDIFIGSFYINTETEQKKDSFYSVKEFHYRSKDEMLELQKNCISSTALANKTAASNMGVTWARLYRRDFVVDNNLSFILGLKRTQDAIFHLYAFEIAEKVDFVDLPVHHYRIWGASASKKASKNFHDTALQIIKNIEKFMKETGKEEVFKNAYDSKVSKLLLEIVKLELAPKSNTDSFQKKLKFLRYLAESEPYCSSVKAVDYSTLTKGQKIGCTLIKKRCYFGVLLMYMLKENR